MADETLLQQIEGATAQLVADSATLHTIVHGDAATSVATDGGSVPSVAKAIADLNAEYASDDTLAGAQAAQLGAETARDEAVAAAATVDSHVKVSLDDTTPGTLEDKLTAGPGVALLTQNGGGNETRQVSADDSGLAEKLSLALPDIVGLHDSEAGNGRKRATVQRILDAASNLSPATGLAPSDSLFALVADVGRKATVEEVLGTVSGLTVAAAPDPAGDYLLIRTAAGARKVLLQDVAGGVPTGTLLAYGGIAAPIGYLECNGQNVSRTTQAALFAAIGETWGVGDGATTFAVPDMRRRTAVGAGGTGTGTLAATVGSMGGAETHSLSSVEGPAHNHSYVYRSTQDTGSGGSVVKPITGTTGGTTGSSGSGAAHNNMQPSAVVEYIIKT